MPSSALAMRATPSGDPFRGHAREREAKRVAPALDQEVRSGDERSPLLGGRLQQLRRVDVVVAA